MKVGLQAQLQVVAKSHEPPSSNYPHAWVFAAKHLRSNLSLGFRTSTIISAVQGRAGNAGKVRDFGRTSVDRPTRGTMRSTLAAKSSSKKVVPMRFGCACFAISKSVD